MGKAALASLCMRLYLPSLRIRECVRLYSCLRASFFARAIDSRKSACGGRYREDWQRLDTLLLRSVWAQDLHECARADDRLDSLRSHCLPGLVGLPRVEHVWDPRGMQPMA